ncbi:MAG: hypothetical protein JKX73_10450, partial [Flavobacteriales bacterium]|nr:hypothetical protein [Flavobacteriales bacterium]
FYLSNDEWEKGEEMTLFDMNEEGGGQEIKMMQEAVLEETLAGEGSRLLYLFDFMNMWTFHVELVQIINASPKVEYPAIVNVTGKPPQQYGNVASAGDEEAILLEALRAADQDSDDIPFQDDIFEGFDEFN